MFFKKQLADNYQKYSDDLSPADLAEMLGTSYANITQHKNEIADQCQTYRYKPKGTISKKPSFTVKNLPAEIEIIKKIIFQNEIKEGELTITQICKKLDIPKTLFFANKDEIEKRSTTAREILITGKKTVLFHEKELSLIEKIVKTKKEQEPRNGPPAKSAKELVMAAKMKRPPKPQE